MTIDFEQAFQILMLAAVVLVFWWSHKSFPPVQTAQLIKELSDASKKTATPVDDIGVEILKALNELRLSQVPPPGITDADDEGEIGVFS